MINKILLKMITQFLRKRIIRDLFSDLNLISLRNILKTHIVKIIIDEDISRLDKSIINRKRQRDEHSNLKKEF